RRHTRFSRDWSSDVCSSDLGVEPGSKGKIPKEAWIEPLYLKRKGHRVSSRPSIIKKVRIVRREGTIHPIRGGSAWVKPGNTHHRSEERRVGTERRARRTA